MARTVETVLRVRDELSPAMAKAAGSVGALTASMDKAGASVDRMGASASKSAQPVVQAQKAWKDLGDAATKAGATAVPAMDKIGGSAGRTEGAMAKLKATMASLRNPNLDGVAKSFNDASEAASKAEAKWKGVGEAGKVLATAGAAMAAGLGLATKASLDWESAFAGVRKTVDNVDFGQLEGELRGLAKTMPIAHEEIAGLAQAAGALGVAGPKIASFTKTAAELGVAVDDLSAEEAATGIAQIANVMGTFNKPMVDGVENVDRFASALVHLGNNGASTEGQILKMAQRMASAGASVGMSEQGVLALSNTLASMGVRAELGGGVTTRALLKINSAVMDGGEGLQAFADASRVSADQFANAWKADPQQAMLMLANGLSQTKAEGGNMAAVLQDLGFKGTEDLQVLLALANGNKVLEQSIKDAADAWTSGDKAQQEAQKRFETNASKIQIAQNQIKDAMIDVGGAIAPVVAGVAQAAGALANTFGSLPGPAKTVAGAVAGVATAVTLAGGAALMLVPKLAAAQAAMVTLGASSTTAATAIGAVGTAAKVAGVGVVALAAAWGAAKLAEAGGQAMVAKEGVDQLAASLGQLGAGAGAAQSFVNIMSTAQWDVLGQNPKTAAEALTLFGESAKRALDPTIWNQVDFMGQSRTVGEFGAQVEQLDASLASMVSSGNAAGAAQAWQQLSQAAKEQGVNVDDLKAKFPQYAAALANTTGAAGATKAAVDPLTGEIKETGDAADKAAEAFQKMLDVWESLNGAVLNSRASAREVAAGWDDLTQAIKENGANLDINTDKGRANAAAIDKQAKSVAEHAANRIREGADINSVSREYDTNRDKLIKMATQMTGSKAKAEAWADSIGLTKGRVRELSSEIKSMPGQKVTKIDVNTAEGKRKLSEIAQTIAGIPTERQTTWTVQTRVVDPSQVIGLVRPGSRSGGGIPRMLARATGGPIVGPGTGTSDSILARLSNGEHVLTAREVAAAGGHDAVARIRKALLAGRLDVPAYAGGGPVGFGKITTGLGFNPKLQAKANEAALQITVKAVELPVKLQIETKQLEDLKGLIGRNLTGLEDEAVSAGVGRVRSAFGALKTAMQGLIKDPKELAQATAEAQRKVDEARIALARTGADVRDTSAALTEAGKRIMDDADKTLKAAADRTRTAQKDLVDTQAKLALAKKTGDKVAVDAAQRAVADAQRVLQIAQQIQAEASRAAADQRRVAAAKASSTYSTASGKAPNLKGALGSAKAAPYRAQIIAAGLKYGVAPELLAAQINAESGWNPRAVSKAGAKGLAQFMPGTARSVGLKNPFDPKQAIEAQAKLMGEYAKKYAGDITKMLAAYNAGPGNVKRWSSIKETRGYVNKIGKDAGVATLRSGRAGSSVVSSASTSKAVAQTVGGGTNALVEQMISNAEKLVGRYYKWGGGHGGNSHTSNLNKALVDCSGLINTALGHVMKKNVNRVAKDWTRGKNIKSMSVAEGLKTRGAFLGTDKHVVMSLGDGRIIEAPQTGKKVRIIKADPKRFTRAGWYTPLGTPGKGGGGIAGAGDVDPTARLQQMQAAADEAQRALEAQRAAADALGEAMRALSIAVDAEKINQANIEALSKGFAILEKWQPKMEQIQARYEETVDKAKELRAEHAKLVQEAASFADQISEKSYGLGAIGALFDKTKQAREADFKAWQDYFEEAQRLYAKGGLTAEGFAARVANAANAQQGDNGIGGVIAARRQALTDLAEQRKVVGDLIALGLNEEDLRAAMGDAELAQAIAKGGAASIAELNDLNAQLKSVADSMGTQYADGIYADQVAAADQVAKAWEDKADGLKAVMEKLGEDLGTALTAAMGIGDGKLAQNMVTKFLADMDQAWRKGMGLKTTTSPIPARPLATPQPVPAGAKVTTHVTVTAPVTLDGKVIGEHAAEYVYDELGRAVQASRVKAGVGLR